MIRKFINTRSVFAVIVIAVSAMFVSAQGLKRIVVVKIDGLPNASIDKYVVKKDPKTGKSMLPWFEEIFYKNGTRVENFYTRGISLSGPAWGMIDTGQHMQVKGNVEFDRFTLQTYDYLRFFSFFLDNFFAKRADMPAAEVMSQMKIPLLVDMFPYEHRYHSPQLYMRDNNWLGNLGSGFISLFPRDRTDLLNEYTLGFPFLSMTVLQNEREIAERVVTRPEIDYYDYFDTSFDHVLHDNNDEESRIIELKKLDLTLGRFWTRIQASSRKDETALILVSDHGFNAKEPIFSQGFNLVTMFTNASGGGHHVMTKRRILLDYAVKGVNPLVPAIITPSKNTYYLKGEHSAYPTALVDFDGNERSSVHLRESGLNMMHMLLQQLQRKNTSITNRRLETAMFFDIVDEHRNYWKQNADELDEDLGALQRWIDEKEKIVKTHPKEYSVEDRARGIDKDARRLEALVTAEKENVAAYRKYIITLRNLLSLSRENFRPNQFKIEELIAPGSMGRSNSIHEMQHYVVGMTPGGILVGPDGEIDYERSFVTVNYFKLLHSQTIRSNLQKGVSNKPIDFIAIRVPLDAIVNELPEELRPNDNPVWLYGGEDKQALILSRTAADGTLSLRYLPISGLTQDANGKIAFTTKEWAAGFPLKIFEDDAFTVSIGERAAWLSQWHTEFEWLHATHKTMYSNAVIGLNEQLDRHPVFDENEVNLSADDKLIRRFRQRQRDLTESDMLILANNHWNFDIRGFNPGGNHGSFFRVSTNATFMMAGGERTGIPRGLGVTEPYDSLSVMPTILSLMGRIDDANRPDPELFKMGYRRFPGRQVSEITGRQTISAKAASPSTTSPVK
ncbi:MAG: alkaline phosphatase family protein [Pyrinomonadaceae bacterium]